MSNTRLWFAFALVALDMALSSADRIIGKVYALAMHQSENGGREIRARAHDDLVSPARQSPG
jgi:hypothetical protein